jgi:hypothetical protein
MSVRSFSSKLNTFVVRSSSSSSEVTSCVVGISVSDSVC